MRRPAISAAAMAFGALALWIGAASALQRISPYNLAPYVPSPEPVVEKMLEAADLKAGETLFDLGCGDGRILFLAAEKFRANAVGVELSAKLVQQTRDKVRKLGLQDRITVVEGNLLDVNLRTADVVTLYLMRMSNEKLKPNLLKELRAGARVVSHDYEIPGWKPIRIERLLVHQRTHTIYVYRMPPAE